MNLRSVFTDTSPNYLKPYQPKLSDPVSVRLRIPKNCKPAKVQMRVNYRGTYLLRESPSLESDLNEVRRLLRYRAKSGPTRFIDTPLDEHYPRYYRIDVSDNLTIEPQYRVEGKGLYDYLIFNLPAFSQVFPSIKLNSGNTLEIFAPEIDYFFIIQSEDGELYKVDATVAMSWVYPRYLKICSLYPFRIVPDFSTPEWVKGAVLYQIFPDRFYNGDPENDPVDGEYIYEGKPIVFKSWNELPDSQRPHPEGDRVREFFGGDLKGIMEKLPYLKELGIEGIYLNPIFLSPSNHRYDIMDYEHVDPRLGVRVGKPSGKPQVNHASLEESDKLFTELVRSARRYGIRLILDGVFNHCGSSHRWLNREKYYDEPGAYSDPNSPFRNYFKFLKDNWPDNDHYEAWWDIKTLPKLNYEASYELFEYIMNIATLWLKRGAMGWRLDVAPELGHSQDFNIFFWHEFRKRVKKFNPSTYIVAEAYGRYEEWFRSNTWDSLMNYQAFFEPVSWFFTGMDRHSTRYEPRLKLNTAEFIRRIVIESSFLPWPALSCAMNQLSNHDHSRFLTRTSGIVDTSTDGIRPSQLAYEKINYGVFKCAVAFMMIWPGAPTIYYGDEVGLAGFSDPDNRRPFPWDDMNIELLEFHRDLIKLRREFHNLRNWSYAFIQAEGAVFTLTRFRGHKALLLVINPSSQPQTISIDLRFFDKPVLSASLRFEADPETHRLTDEPLEFESQKLTLSLLPYSLKIIAVETER